MKRLAAILVPMLIFRPLFASDFKGTDWLRKNRDVDGCLPLAELVDTAKSKSCPLSFEPQIRPMTVGTLDRAKTEARKKAGKALCCYSWEVFGNR